MAKGRALVRMSLFMGVLYMSLSIDARVGKNGREEEWNDGMVEWEKD